MRATASARDDDPKDGNDLEERHALGERRMRARWGSGARPRSPRWTDRSPRGRPPTRARGDRPAASLPGDGLRATRPHPLQPHAQRLAGEHDGPPPPRRRHANARATPASEPHVVKRQIKRRPKCENRDVAHWWLHSQVAADGPWWLPSKAAGFRRNSPNGPSKQVRRSNASRAGPMRDTRISARSKR